MKNYLLPIYHSKLKPWIKWWLLKQLELRSKTLSDWIEGTTPITITGAFKEKIQNLELEGNTSQTGTPTPETPIPVQVVKGHNVVKINTTEYPLDLKSKNLLQTIDWTGTKNGCPIALSSDNSFSSNGTTTGTQVVLGIDLIGGATANYGLYVNANATKIKLEAGSYTLSIANVQGTLENVGENFFLIGKYREGQSSGTLIKQTNFSSMPMTFTLEEETEVFIGYQVQYTKANDYSFNFMLEKGNQSTTFESYYNIELCKIGDDYSDYILPDNNGYKILRSVGKVVYNGTENWSKDIDKNDLTDYFYVTSQPITSSNVDNCLCDHFIKGTNETQGYWATAVFCITINKTNTGIISTDGKQARIDKFKAWLASNNTTVYYRLATTTTETITNTNLISQLDAIYNAEFKNGTNTIIQTNSDLPFILHFKYYKRG